jgi:quercetin dioxygenase-like cupin family protein
MLFKFLPMAYSNKVISNPQTGQSIKFLQTARDTAGRLLEMESTYLSRSQEPPLHYHPVQSEVFTVLQGELTVLLNGEKKLFRAGQQLNIPPGCRHAMWNESEGITTVNWKVIPAMDTEYLLETGMGLAFNGKTNKNGMPRFLQVVMMASSFEKVFRLAKPPYLIQKLLFTVLKPVALLAGYRGRYKEYID